MLKMGKIKKQTGGTKDLGRHHGDGQSEAGGHEINKTNDITSTEGIWEKKLYP